MADFRYHGKSGISGKVVVMKTYRVGGSVRDRLLGLPHADSDWVVVGATPEDMVALGYTPVGKDFPVFLHPQTREEYALARTERKSGRGYKGFRVHASPDVSLEDDLRRRDLTINAMAQDEDGALIDPFGGRTDLDARLLRHVSPAFVEDPLRILRVARFAARLAPLGFTIAPATLTLMKDMALAGELRDLTAERVWTETARALGEQRPWVYFQILRDCAALRELFPEIDALFGVPQRADYHPEIDTGVHTLMVLEQAATLSTDLRVRFAALTHDLGKGTTPPAEWPRHVGHEHRSVDLVKAFCKRWRVPNDCRDLAVLVARYHGICHRAEELRPRTVLELLSNLDAFRRSERVELFLLACEADARGRLGLEQAPYPQADLLRTAYAAARDVPTAPLQTSGITGPQLGEAIARARTQAIAAVLRENRPPGAA